MRARRVLATTLAIAILPAGTASASDTPRPDCAEYTPERVIFGELQTVNCDVSPPQHLDLQMYPRRLDGHSPRWRCEHMGGHYQIRRYRCLDVDY